MKPGRIGVLALCVLAAPALGAHAAPPALRIVTISALNGLPPDSSSRGTFLAAFQSEFDAEERPCEKHAGEQWTASGERLNRFRLVDVAAPEDAWSLEVTVGLPPPVVIARPAPKDKPNEPTHPRYTDYRAARGLTIVASA